MPMQEFIFSKVADLESPTLLNSKLLHTYFLDILILDFETPITYGCFVYADCFWRKTYLLKPTKLWLKILGPNFFYID